ncbi:Monothiol glutaredoxin-related [Trema orientale]|uniref:Monothiol glutaredoxin-related n=1 Tax=Trema orientale TaxID=63057 RepID=A0A2P5EV28_TREOI|nr:Monothiol glutaredoxin-related [Trema orientale]
MESPNKFEISSSDHFWIFRPVQDGDVKNNPVMIYMKGNMICYALTGQHIFIKGEFIGGSDIILNLHQNGELKEKLKDIVANQEKSE